ncbi:hypothetical protein [Moorena sp. SIO4G3]|uniref:hypothetical protein n=1 Tax=Moorena sp. SIO4G3 TaxID=2607821 RepID=UPI00142BBC7E|nr:hypothetical protein [Moorena sp. SIO4G3]NEO77727.1 hypothetical protein [Moorena sp. SIO4G3]
MLIVGRAGCPLYSYSVEWASGVELASCQFHAYCRAGRMPTLLRFSGMGIRRGTGILPVSCLFSGGQDAHSTAIDSKLPGGQDAHSTPIHWKIQQPTIFSPLAEC